MGNKYCIIYGIKREVEVESEFSVGVWSLMKRDSRIRRELVGDWTKMEKSISEKECLRIWECWRIGEGGDETGHRILWLTPLCLQTRKPKRQMVEPI